MLINLRHLFLLLTFGILFGSCSKEDDSSPATSDLPVAFFSIKIQFDELGFNPEWIVNLSGYYYHKNKDLTIEGYQFWKELDTEMGVNNFYGTSFFSEDQLIQQNIHIEFDQKASGLHFTLMVKENDRDIIKPSGKVILFKNNERFKEFPISRETMFAYTLPFS